jgi:DNA-binding response OmpR family regulator
VGENRHCLVLVVEDDPSIAQFVESVLADEGYEVQVTPTAEQGLQRIAQRRPAVVLLDMILPGMSGSDFVAELRKAYGHSIPVVLMTAAREEPAQAGLAPEGLLLKPFELNALLREVERVTRELCPQPGGKP